MSRVNPRFPLLSRLLHPGQPRRHPRTILALLALAITLLLVGCEAPGYYAQAVRGHIGILTRQKPIERWLASDTTPAPLKTKLQRVLELRHFAETNLALKANGHYLSYADLGRPYVVWNIYATPEFSMEDTTWWYPVVGRLSYRGYFDELRATRYAERLKQQGLDVHVSGIEAYSTLGWFKDPVLNTFIHHSDINLAETLFHELAHQRVFAAGDTDFNEAFATAVGEEGVRRWLTASRRTNELVNFNQSQQRQREFATLILSFRTELEALFKQLNLPDTSSGPSHPALDHARTEKARAYTRLRTRYATLKESWNGYQGYDAWMNGELNNARLNTISTYYEWVPAFERLLASHHGQLEPFYRHVHQLANLRKSARTAALAPFKPAPTP